MGIIKNIFSAIHTSVTVSYRMLARDDYTVTCKPMFETDLNDIIHFDVSKKSIIIVKYSINAIQILRL
jgi:hypothetical protein